MAQTADSFGRVDDDGTVHVLDGDAWRPVGSFPDGTPEEALAYFRRKFDDLAATLTLAEQRIKAKANAKDIRTQLAKMGKDLLEPAAVGDLAGLRAKVEALLEKLPDLAKEQDAEAEVVVTEAIAHREGIVTQMEALAAKEASAIRWKSATTTMAELFETWQNHQQNGPRIPKKTADALWSRFRGARASLEKARRAYFHELDGKSKEVKTAKRDLISKAEALASQGTAGIAAYRKLLDQWKLAPRASRSVEDTLWASFKAAGDVLYSAKAELDKVEDAANEEHLVAKQALITEFADILTLNERDAASARLRAFHQKFSALGPVPKKSMRSVDDLVKKYDTHVKKLEEDFWVKNDPEKKARSESMATQIYDAIAKIEAKIAKADGGKKAELEAELEAKKAWLAVIGA
jgi:hypothetical protein